VIAQVSRIVDDVGELPRVDIPARGSTRGQADKPFFIEPLHARPASREAGACLMAMMAIRGIYERHQVRSLNHGIGFNTAGHRTDPPTYGEQLGLKGKITATGP
jgi:malonate decarboxylase alpha subunit